ncbi:hypothetical protein GCM10027589_20690 [Actinocorallia lasiicapitis]
MVNDQRPTVDRAGLRATWLGLSSLVLAIFCTPLPLGVVVGIAAVVIGLKARKPGVKVRGAVPGIVLGIIGAILSTIMFGMSMYLMDEITGFRKCMTTANTNTDEKNCEDIWLPKMEKKLHVPAGSFDQYRGWF